MPLEIKLVDNHALANQWLHVSDIVYRDDANYIPHLKQDLEKVFDLRRNKFYQQGNAKRWIAFSDHGQPLGRIAAFHWDKYSKAQKQPTGGIGFFECIDRHDVAHALFDVACAWLKSEGMAAVDGPINFGEKDAWWGLVIQNFTDMHSYKMNFNPPYYQKFFESYGFQIYYEQWCFRRAISKPPQDVFVRKNALLMQEQGFTVRNARGMRYSDIASYFLQVYNEGWAGHAGFKEMELAQAIRIVKSMKPIMDRDLIIFAFHDNRPIGFYISIPELNEIFRHIGTNFNLWGKLKFLYYKTFAKRSTMVGIVFGIDKAYHGKGVEAAMIQFAYNSIIKSNRYSSTILTWIGDWNPKMIKVAENLEAERYRVLATYRLIFDPNVTFERHPIVL